MPIHDFGEWYYLIYLIPGGAALFILLASVLGGHHKLGGHGHVGGHGHFGGHGHIGAHHGATPIAAHGHSALIGNAAHSPASHGDAGGGDGPDEQRSLKAASDGATLAHVHPKVTESFGAFFGVDRVPMTMVAGSLCLGWGMFGVYGTEFWSGVAHSPIVFVPMGAVSGAIGGVLTGRFMALLGSKMLPKTESFAVSSVELFGCYGNVVYPVDTQRGRVHVRDGFGTLHDKEARTRSGEIPRGRSVLVLDFDNETDRLIVEESPERA